MCCILLVRSSVDGHLGCYVSFVYDAVRSVHVQMSAHIPTFNPSSCLPQCRTVETHGILGLSFDSFIEVSGFSFCLCFCFFNILTSAPHFLDDNDVYGIVGSHYGTTIAWLFSEDQWC